jgi:hypothetical protein
MSSPGAYGGEPKFLGAVPVIYSEGIEGRLDFSGEPLVPDQDALSHTGWSVTPNTRPDGHWPRRSGEMLTSDAQEPGERLGAQLGDEFSWVWP